jgi:hypothetical protein
MAWYRAEDVISSLCENNCKHLGDLSEMGVIWSAADGMRFILPYPEDGWFQANVIDEILSDQWIWAGTRHRYDAAAFPTDTRVFPDTIVGLHRR